MLTLNQLKKLYTAIPFDIRNGKEYRKWRDFLKKDIDIDKYELLKLKETVLYAYENTKYYKNLFNKEDISPYDILNKKDFQTIPTIHKNIVRDYYYDFLVNSLRSQLYLDYNDNSQILFPGLIIPSEMLKFGITKYQIVQEKKGG